VLVRKRVVVLVEAQLVDLVVEEIAAQILGHQAEAEAAIMAVVAVLTVPQHKVEVVVDT
jgi:hypothetical protein